MTEQGFTANLEITKSGWVTAHARVLLNPVCTVIERDRKEPLLFFLLCVNVIVL
jgi:hypothetical protein